MDDIVRQAMLKWPNVPDCYGWLGLDARGQWFLRDEHTQTAGPFSENRGSLLEHEGLIAFIGRNYGVDEQGCGFFQNGPQKVFVELEVTPWVWRLQPDGLCLSHTGLEVNVLSLWQDEEGVPFLEASVGLGIVHSQDVYLLAQWIEDRNWSLTEVKRDVLLNRFNVILSPVVLSSKP